MATRMGIRELRDTLTQAIRRVQAGETIEVTNAGEPVAVITAYRRNRLDQLIAEGRATPPRRPLRLPVPREARGPLSPADALQEDRGD